MKVLKQKVKKTIPKKESRTEEMKRYLGALSEDFRSQVSSIAEQFLGLNKKVDANTEMTGQILEDVTVLKEEMKEVQSEMKEVKAELKTMNGRLDTIERELADIKRELAELKKIVVGKAGEEKVLELEARVARIEEYMHVQKVVQ